MAEIKLKPVQIGWMLKCSIAGKHIEQEYNRLENAVDELKRLQSNQETFVGQITIIPIYKYVEIFKQRGL